MGIDLLAGPMVPFTAALCVMAALVVLELAGALIGALPSGLLDGALDLDADADLGGAATPLSWIGVGKVPLLIVLIAFLTAFGLAGVATQSVAAGLFGGLLPAWLASAPALAVALPATGLLARGLGRLLPSEESEASSADGHIGKIATLGAATARVGLPAEAKLRDAHGQTHYVRIEPAEGNSLPAGSRVLLISRTGGIYAAVRDPGDPSA